MKRFKQSLILLLHFVFVLNAFCSYAHEEPIDVKESETEIWELQLTGDTEGKLKMKLKQVQIAGDTYSIIGEFSGRIKDHIGGRGRLKCKLEGKIEKEAFLADFSGSADMQASHVLVRGTIKGSISDSHGFGTWNMRHSRGSSAGKWTTKKIKTLGELSRQKRPFILHAQWRHREIHRLPIREEKSPPLSMSNAKADPRAHC